jgi:hypothetical protein
MDNTDSVENVEIDRGFDSLIWSFGVMELLGLGGLASAIKLGIHLQPLRPANGDD